MKFTKKDWIQLFVSIVLGGLGMLEPIHPWLGHFLIIIGVTGIIVTLIGGHNKACFPNLKYQILKNKITSIVDRPDMLFNRIIKRIDLVTHKDADSTFKYTLIVSAPSQDTRYKDIYSHWNQTEPLRMFGQSLDEIYEKDKENDQFHIFVQPSSEGLPDSVDKKRIWNLYKMGVYRKLKYLYGMSK